jgi:transcriptional regulator with XRE-family HTH domain
MLSRTLERGLGAYQIGEKLRTLRLKKKMGLVELGRHSALSPALLSKLERGLVFPTLPTLLRIALVFGVGLEYFFVDDRRRPPAIVRASERIRFPEKPNGQSVSYSFESLDYPAVERKSSAYKVEFYEVAAKHRKTHQHAGAEFIYLIQGRLILTIGSEEHVLEADDSVYFDASVPHSYRKGGTKACLAIVVATP